MNVDLIMKKINTILGLTILFLFLSSSFIIFVSGNYTGPSNDTIENDVLATGSNAYDWTLAEIKSNQNLTFSDFAGKIIIINFWEISIGASETAFSILKSIREDYSTSQVVIMSIDINPISDSKEEVVEYISDHEIPWYVFLDTVGVYIYYQISLIPTCTIIDQNQKVFDNVEGLDKEGVNLYSALKESIDSLIDSPPTTTNNGGSPMSEFWQKNWYWFVVGSVFLIIAVALIIQRRRVVLHNRKIREQKMEARQRRARKRER